MQEQKIAPSVGGASSSFDKLKEEFAKVSKSELGVGAIEEQKPLTRWVSLVHTDWCGCFNTTVNIDREVPYDSDLKDGDPVTGDLLPGDRKSISRGGEVLYNDDEISEEIFAQLISPA